MLRAATVLAASVSLVLVALPSVSWAEDGPIRVKGNNDGVVSTTVTDPGAPASTGDGDGDGAGAGDGKPAACTWLQVLVFEQWLLPADADGQPGKWWQQYCNNNGWKAIPVFVPFGTPPAAVLQVSPGTLAERAANELRLPMPRVGLNPAPRALVNLPEWFWVPLSSWEPLRQRTQAGAVWAVVVARPTATTWDPGDGSSPFTCRGPGTAYATSEPASAQQTDCSYSYRRSSADQPQSGPDPNDRFFTVTVTTTWSVTWTGAGGSGGTLPPLTRSRSFRLAVAERDAVVTGGSG
jgi:hypothetical protein